MSSPTTFNSLRVPANPVLREVIQLAFASNERYFPGLYCAVVSALTNLDPHRSAVLHILDGGVTEPSKALLQSIVSTIRSDTLISWHAIDESLFSDAPLGPGKSKMAYARILLPDLLQVSKCLYLDCDILVFRDIAELFDVVLNPGSAIAAVQDSETLTFAYDIPLIAHELSLPLASLYCNSGVMLMDLDLLRNEKFLSKSLSFLKTWKGKYHYWDQSAINVLLHNRIDWLPGHWNRASWLFDGQEDNSLNCLLHYTSSAPWLGGKAGPAQKLFERFAESVGLSVNFNSVDFRNAKRKQFLLCVLSPVRALAFPLFSAFMRIAGFDEKAKAYNNAARHWRDFIIHAYARRKLHRRRISQLNEIPLDLKLFPLGK